MTVTRSELQAWLDTWNENHAAPSADSVVDFLGIELAEPEPETPVGQRRRSPDGVEVADWKVITDAPKCNREHLPEGCVPINPNGWPSDELRAELARRGESS